MNTFRSADQISRWNRKKCADNARRINNDVLMKKYSASPGGISGKDEN